MTVFTTSGTTRGKPKTFSLTDAQLDRRIAEMNDTTRGTGFEAIKSIFCDFHQSTYIGTRYIHYGQQHAVRIVFPAHGTIEATVAMIKDQGIEGIASTPQGLMNYAQAIIGSHTFKWIMASTAGMSGPMSRSIRAGLGDNLWSSYACSEAGTIALANAEQIESQVGCVGKIVSGVEIKFIDGEIVIKSDTLIDGYDDEPDLTAKSFKDGWYHTGDRGHMVGDLLVFDGRLG